MRIRIKCSKENRFSRNINKEPSYRLLRFVNVSEIPLATKTLQKTVSAADVAVAIMDFSPYMKKVLGVIHCQALTSYGSSRTMCTVAITGTTEGHCSFVSAGESLTAVMTVVGIPK